MQIDVPGEAPGLVLEEGRVTRQGILVVERDDQGLPKTVVGEDLNAVKRFARSMGKKPEEIRLSEIKATEAVEFRKQVPVVCREFEIVALKSALLTFDHLLRDSPDRFTRHADLHPVRQFIREAVIGQHPDSDVLSRLSLGLQYAKRGLYDRLRAKIGVPQSDFEHVLFVSTEARKGILEVVWLVFGFDPFGFQICPWPHSSFTYAVVNPILRNEGYSGPHRLDNPREPLCQPTDLCTYPWFMTEQQNASQIIERISLERREAYGRAVKLVETTCDENLIELFQEAAEQSIEGDRNVQRQVRNRLIRMYGRKEDDPEFHVKVDTLLAQHARGTNPDLLSRRVDESKTDSTFDWASIIRLYRNCLIDLEPEFGLPGDAVTHSHGVRIDPSEQRLIGKLPSMDS